MHFSLLFI